MSTKKILVLGSGMVAGPCVDYLLRDDKNELTIACRTLSTAQAVAAARPRVKAISLDVESPDLDAKVAEHDLVISLVPFIYHIAVVQSAIKSKTHVVTTSYVSPALRDLESQVKDAGITVLNEVGVDPGVDHLYAVKLIGEVHDKGGKIKEFYSYCGGLPAPEASHNPLRFKFSWSPRGALLSQFNSALFLKDGIEIEISNQGLMASAQPYHIMDGYSFLAYPNRNSLPFREFYQIPEAQTIIRGSLRYDGNPQLVKALINLGWLDSEKKGWLMAGITWAEILQKLVQANSTAETDLLPKVVEICGLSGKSEREGVIAGLRWMGLFSSGQATVRDNLLDTLSSHLESLCSFASGERDLVILQHKFVVEWQNGKTDTITSTMELLGDPKGYSGMSKAVGVTCGIATQMLLDGHPSFSKPGVHAPYTKEMCDPLRTKVEAEGIKLIEKVL